jgi:hypothetical protein
MGKESSTKILKIQFFFWQNTFSTSLIAQIIFRNVEIEGSALHQFN